MCIRDSFYDLCDRYGFYVVDEANIESHAFFQEVCRDPRYTCLLYTSDAADERSSVDLGGRRIIKKKN